QEIRNWEIGETRLMPTNSPITKFPNFPIALKSWLSEQSHSRGWLACRYHIQPYPLNTLGMELERFSGAVGDVYDAPRHNRPAVINPDDHRPASAPGGDLDHRPQRQSRVG